MQHVGMKWSRAFTFGPSICFGPWVGVKFGVSLSFGLKKHGPWAAVKFSVSLLLGPSIFWVHSWKSSLVLRFYLGLQFLGSIVGSQVGCFPFTCASDFFGAIVGTQVLERHENISIRTQLFIPVCLLHFYKILLPFFLVVFQPPHPRQKPPRPYLFPFFLFKI